MKVKTNLVKADDYDYKHNDIIWYHIDVLLSSMLIMLTEVIKKDNTDEDNDDDDDDNVDDTEEMKADNYIRADDYDDTIWYDIT